jgi:hypothetical protein
MPVCFTLRTFLCLTLLLLAADIAEAQLPPTLGCHLDSPPTVNIGSATYFSLSDGTGLQRIRWVRQVTNPDLYRGNEYISSFLLPLAIDENSGIAWASPLTAGRYRVEAGSDQCPRHAWKENGPTNQPIAGGTHQADIVL